MGSNTCQTYVRIYDIAARDILYAPLCHWIVPRCYSVDDSPLEVNPGPLKIGEPPIMQWKHLDTLSRQNATMRQKQLRQEVGTSLKHENTDSGRQETSLEYSETDEEEEDST